MGLVPPNFGPDPALAVPDGAVLVTTYPVESGPGWFGAKVALEAGTRLRHVRTDYSAECIPDIEYADIYFEVLDGRFLGQEIGLLAFELNGPIRELPELERRFGVVPIEVSASDG